jgi:hypothetical protein
MTGAPRINPKGSKTFMAMISNLALAAVLEQPQHLAWDISAGEPRCCGEVDIFMGASTKLQRGDDAQTVEVFGFIYRPKRQVGIHAWQRSLVAVKVDEATWFCVVKRNQQHVLEVAYTELLPEDLVGAA